MLILLDLMAEEAAIIEVMASIVGRYSTKVRQLLGGPALRTSLYS